MTAASKKGPVQTRLSRCADHGLVQATRQMPRLRFPFIVTGMMWLAALAGVQVPRVRREGGQALSVKTHSPGRAGSGTMGRCRASRWAPMTPARRRSRRERSRACSPSSALA